MKLKFFGTDGIRGPYGSESLNDQIACRAGKAAVQVARDLLGIPAATIVVGRDTRGSGEALLKAFASGARAEGGRVIDLGVVPTPCVAFAARKSGAALACSITASHNPSSDNGIKFFEGSGVKPSEALEQGLDDGVGTATSSGLEEADTAVLLAGTNFREKYAQAILAYFPKGFLDGKKVSLDCANGAMYEVAPMVFSELGAKVTVIGADPDGTNINDGVGSECPDALGSVYSADDYDFGFAFDGDGDRLVMLDGKGNRVAGEALLAMLAVDAKAQGKLADNTLVTTVQSNLGLDAALKPLGITVARTDVGDKHIARLMLKDGFTLGGEESGHILVGDFAITGDGLTAAVALAELVCRSGKSIESLAAIYKPYPQSSQALNVTAKPPLAECNNIAKCIESLSVSLGDEGRFLVRYSGTEPKIRLLIEARTQEMVTECMASLRKAVGKDLEVV